jgi:diguanylate cyclase (GGDEF)-like protein
MVGILRASVALSSQTSLRRLEEQVVDVLAGLTGATAVLVAVRHDASQTWLFSPKGDPAATPMPLAEAGVRGLFPLTAFHFVERTGEQLLVADALRDDRFARDPYFAECAQCSLLVVPIASHGEPRVVLVLENRLGRNAFSASRLDAVMLVAGQLSVSFENALLYASLEQKVAERTDALEAANRELAQLALTDALTGLTNRRGFDEALAAQWRRALRANTSIGLVMIDIDEFKAFNDIYGHLAGDGCLQRVAATLRDGVRPESDLAARYGGEEFVLILTDNDLAETYASAERLRRAVAALREPHARSAHGIVTISVGIVAFVPSQDATATQYVSAADAALYEAKRRGRNQIARAGYAANISDFAQPL